MQVSYDITPDEGLLPQAGRKQACKVAEKIIKILADPVGRQRDIAEIHAKIAVWEKAYASYIIWYPFTIGQIIDQLKQSPDKS
ncbi:MAG: hypothetical protein R3F47_19230 [Gammaproteobacteria bacterium]